MNIWCFVIFFGYIVGEGGEAVLRFFLDSVYCWGARRGRSEYIAGQSIL